MKIRIMPLVVAALCLCVWACSNEQSLLERIDGKWYYDDRATWEFKNPGKDSSYSGTDASGLKLGDEIVFNIKNMTIEYIRAQTGAQGRVSRYVITKELSEKVHMSIQEENEVVEITPDGKLLIYNPERIFDTVIVLGRVKPINN